MYWVIQKEFYSERNHSLLTSALDLLEIPYEEVSLRDVVDTDASFISRNALRFNQRHILVCGSTHLMRVAYQQGWTPGCFLTDNFDFRIWDSAYGKNLLNYDASVGYLSMLNPQVDQFFIRPVEDNKAFNGGVVSKRDFPSWRDSILKHKSDVEVVIAPCKTIYTEIRCFIVDGVIVSASQYRAGGKPLITSVIDPTVYHFVDALTQRWNPSRAYVLDVALTPDGYKVIELNNITASGFYACDVTKIVDTLDQM